ncbi:MAG: hypothetical protein LBE08_12835 [Bifidobacteriaceae bacterium]|nr:hypothetical protein [Bifidobacteriaceae bacterium]
MTLLSGVYAESPRTVADALRQLGCVVVNVQEEMLRKLDTGLDFGKTLRDIPRAEMRRVWRETVENAATIFANTTSPRVLLAHLSWYNPDTREFLSPLQIEPLRKLGVNRIVLLLDDIYDIWTRLARDNYIFHLAHSQADGRLIGNVGGITDRDGHASLGKAENLRILMAWRRTEMVLADTAAFNLGIPSDPATVTPLGLKQGYSALRLAVGRHKPVTAYLSHPITGLRTANQSSSDFTAGEPRLADWPAGLVAETMDLHNALLDRGLSLICPTAIDELRFHDFGGRAYLSRRWPDRAAVAPTPPDPTNTNRARRSKPTPPSGQLGIDYPYQPAQQHRPGFFLPAESGSEEARLTALAVAHNVRDAIFFDISFRDHYIVEHVDHLVVFRPFFTIGTWSSGVQAEFLHWFDRDLSKRRALFVHSRPEVQRRLEAIRASWDAWREDKFAASALEFAALRTALSSHVAKLLTDAGCGNDLEISQIVLGNFSFQGTEQLSGIPAWADGKEHIIENIYRLAGLKTVHKMFTGLPPDDAGPSADPSGIILVEEDDSRCLNGFDTVAGRIAQALGGETLKELSKESLAFHAEFPAMALKVFGKAGLKLWRSMLRGDDQILPKTADDEDIEPTGADGVQTPKRKRILIYTCNEYERNAVLDVFEAHGAPESRDCGEIWNLARLADWDVQHLHGPQSQSGALNSLANALEQLPGVGVVVVIGICALADPAKQQLYDVCLADSVWDRGHTAGKGGTEDKATVKWLTLPPSDPGINLRIVGSATRSTSRISLNRGTFGTGSNKVKDPDVRSSLVQRCANLGGDLIAIDMEAEGLAERCRGKGIPFYCFKGVSDLADGQEDENPATKAGQQECAALAAAQVAKICLADWEKQGWLSPGAEG